jgi:hypothetical protein
MAYAQVVGELAQDALALSPEHSRILWYVQLEAFAGGIAIFLLLMLFAFAVTTAPQQKKET